MKKISKCKFVAVIMILGLMVLTTACGSSDSEGNSENKSAQKVSLSGNTLVSNNFDGVVDYGETLLPGDFGVGVFGCDSYERSDINEITFLDTLDDIKDDAWDVSADGDGSVMAWVINENGKNNLYIAGEGGVDANEYSRKLFCNYKNLQTINFNDCFSTSNVRNMRGMFSGCKSLESIDLSGFDTSNVRDMSDFFSQCDSLQELDLSSFDTSNVTNMCFMFYGGDSLQELNVSGFDTSNVTDMSSFFSGCSALKELDVSGFNTSNVTNMNNMFAGCENLKELDVSGFDTSNVTDMKYMFWQCSDLEDLDISNFDMSNAQTGGMFKGTMFE